MNIRSPKQSVVYGQGPAGILAFIATIVPRLRDARARCRAMAQLETLSNAQLRDIGVQRELIPLIVEQAWPPEPDSAGGEAPASDEACASLLVDAMER